MFFMRSSDIVMTFEMDPDKFQQEFLYRIEEPDLDTKEKYPDVSTCVFVGPKKYCLPKTYATVASKLYNFEVRQDDVWVLGPPRSGTTLTSELVWLLSNNLDFKKAAETVLEIRLPLLEGAACFQDEFTRIKKEMQSYSERASTIAEELSKPAWEKLGQNVKKRFIRTHLPLSLAPSNLLSSGCKVVYVARNPKDVCVSCYCLMKSFKNFGSDISFLKYWDYFRNGLVMFTPYLEHIKEGWNNRDKENVHFLFYEDYFTDMRQTIRALANFLEKTISEDDLDKLVEHVKMNNFQKNVSVNNDHWKDLGILKNEENNFIRKGVVAKGSDYFQGRLASDADHWLQDNLKDTDLKFLE